MMRNWQTELEQYVTRLETALANISGQPPHPLSVPHGPLDSTPSPLQGVIHRAVCFYEMGAWSRTQETTEAIMILWSRGYVAPGAVLARLLFEIWAASKYLSDALSTYFDKREFEKLEQKVNKIFEGVRSEVLMPWGAAAAETSVHVLDTIRGLRGICPDSIEKYEDLCESAHANQPRFMEWWFLGKIGDNWTNETVQQRGHDLLARTTGAIEMAVSGVKSETIAGLAMCDELYLGRTSGGSIQAAAP